MAILEIHDGYGRVERRTISQESPILFGSSSKCEIVLTAMGVEPFHGRIRWKAGRYKVDAYPNVETIELNGQRIKSATLHQGDEISFGPCRIFLIQGDDAEFHDDRTVEKAPPTARPVPTTKASAAAPWMASMPMAPPSVEGAMPTSPPNAPTARPVLKRSRSWGPKTKDLEALGGSEPVIETNAPKSGLKRSPIASLKSFFSFKDQAPGDDRVASPMVVGLAVALAIILVLSWSLWTVIQKSNAQRLYAKAVEDYDSGDYRNAVRDFELFLTSFPKHTEADKAQVLKALATVRQHTGGGSPSWGNALDSAEAMFNDLAENSHFQDSSTDLADQTLRIAEGLADRAKELSDSELLTRAESAVSLHRKITGNAATALLAKSQATSKINQAKLSIAKSKRRAAGIAAMEAAVKSQNATEIYNARDSLLADYPDLSIDKEVVARLTRANEFIQKAVRFDESGRPGETEPRPEILGPPVSFVLRAASLPIIPNRELVYALVDGLAFGLDGTSGTPIWQKPVGLASPFPPMPIPGGIPTVLVADARSNELLKLNARTGALIWRQTLEEPITDRPLILGNQIIQPLPSGKLLTIDVGNGALRGTLHLGRRVTRTPVADEAGQVLYVLAEDDVLFVLSRDPFSCVGVEYIGHQKGSILCPPARVGRYLVIAENHTLDSGRLRVYLLSEDGLQLRRVQELPVTGWIWGTPVSAGTTLWSLSDRGEIAAYSVGAYDAPTPFTMIARAIPDEQSSGPAYGLARSERELWVSSGRSARYALDVEKLKQSPAWTLGEAGSSRGPIQVANKWMILTQQNGNEPGVALLGVDPANGQVKWKTILGAPWPVAPASPGTSGVFESFGVDGTPIQISRETLRSGGFVEGLIPRPTRLRLPIGALRRIEVPGATLLVQPGRNQMLVREGNNPFHPVELPAPVGTTPLVWGANLLIPSVDSRIYLIDPKNGASLADPFMPPFEKSQPVVWLRPVLLDGDAVALVDTEGRLRRITRSATPRSRLVVTTDFKLDKPLAAEPASTGASLILLTTDNKVRSLAARDLSPQGAWQLESPVLWGPVAIEGHAFLGDAEGRVLAFAADGRRLWTSPPSKSIAASAPIVRDGAAWLVGRDGTLVGLSIADGSLKRDPSPLGILPNGPVVPVGAEFMVPTGWSSVRRFETNAAVAVRSPVSDRP